MIYSSLVALLWDILITITIELLICFPLTALWTLKIVFKSEIFFEDNFTSSHCAETLELRHHDVQK